MRAKPEKYRAASDDITRNTMDKTAHNTQVEAVTTDSIPAASTESSCTVEHPGALGADVGADGLPDFYPGLVATAAPPR